MIPNLHGITRYNNWPLCIVSSPFSLLPFSSRHPRFAAGEPLGPDAGQRRSGESVDHQPAEPWANSRWEWSAESGEESPRRLVERQSVRPIRRPAAALRPVLLYLLHRRRSLVWAGERDAQRWAVHPKMPSKRAVLLRTANRVPSVQRSQLDAVDDRAKLWENLWTDLFAIG